jgi:hypothetical protein
VLTAVVAPAILTNACSVLSLGTANRIARVVDQTRALAAARNTQPPGGEKDHIRHLGLLETRGTMLLRALRNFYGALGGFAFSALVAVVGSALAAYDLEIAFRIAAAVGFISGASGVSALVFGCVLMVRETRLAIQMLTEELTRDKVAAEEDMV